MTNKYVRHVPITVGDKLMSKKPPKPLDKLEIKPPPTPPQKPKKVLQVKIFQGEYHKVQDSFNKFMRDNIDNDLDIYKIDTDTDNGFVSKITIYFYAKLK